MSDACVYIFANKDTFKVKSISDFVYFDNLNFNHKDYSSYVESTFDDGTIFHSLSEASDYAGQLCIEVCEATDTFPHIEIIDLHNGSIYEAQST